MLKEESLTEGRALALFDVDGTLVRTEGSSRHNRAFKAAFRQVFGADCSFVPGMHGMPDLQIFMVLSKDLDIVNGRHRELAESACRALVEIYATPDETDGTYEALPGTRSLLEKLRAAGVILGLVTGNPPEIARDKLTATGLAEFFSFGAFGTEAEERGALPPMALERAERLAGSRMDPEKVFIIGDTPRDVACALDNGYRAIAVATGHVSVADLLGTGAELVLPDLLDPEPMLRLMGLKVAGAREGTGGASGA